MEEYPDSRELEQGLIFGDGELDRKNLRKIKDDPELAELLDEPDPDAEPSENAAHAYHVLLSAAPGTKLGGYPSWIQDPDYPSCPECAETMEHYLTIASAEWDGASGQRWKPVESDDRHNADAGIMVNDVGSLYVFVCKRHPVWSVAQRSQGS